MVSDSAELIFATKNHALSGLRTAPGGQSLLFTESKPEDSWASSLKQIPLSGGAPRTIATGTIRTLCCPIAPGTECVFEFLDEQKHQSKFVAYNSAQNKIRYLFAAPDNTNGYWNISPDGRQLALLQPGRHNGTIQFRSLTGKIEREIQVKG